MKLTNEQLATAHAMEAAAIGIASEFMSHFGNDTCGMMTFMLALKIVKDEYPNLYPNVSNAPQLITEWIVSGSKESQHPIFAKRPAGKRLLNFPELKERTH